MDGHVIAGRYEIGPKVGSGGMGSVWKAADRVLDRTVAVKILHEGLASDATFAERFRREARAAARLAHPNIVTVFDTGVIGAGGVGAGGVGAGGVGEGGPHEGGQPHEGIPYIVMEFVEGRSLHEIIQDGPLPVADVRRIAHSVLSALAHAHGRGLIHRDIKPANILIDSSSDAAKIVDFGIAKGADDAGVTNTSSLIGTASYMSPEQLSGRNATSLSDLYAVGCLLYCCLTGEPPFGGEGAVAIAMHHINDPAPRLSASRSEVPPSLEAALMKALEKDPARRFRSAQAMDEAINGDALAGPITGEETRTWNVIAADPIKVLLVDDHQLITEVLGELIAHETDMQIVGRAVSANAAKRMARELEPDVILMDHDLPDEDVASAAQDILLEHPHARILMLTGDKSDEAVIAAIEAGCSGFVPREQAVEQVVAAIRSAHAGQAPISQELLARLILRDRNGGEGERR